MESVRKQMRAHRILPVNILCMDFVKSVAAPQRPFAFFFLEPGYVPDKWPSNKQNIPAILQRTYILSSEYTVMTTLETAPMDLRVNPKVSKVAKNGLANWIKIESRMLRFFNP